MYSGFVGTVLSHFLSLISTLWTIITVSRCSLQSRELNYILLGLLLVAANSSLALVRYGNSDGYKLRRLHIFMLNLSAILYFTIIEGVFFTIGRSSSSSSLSSLVLYLPFLNVFPLLSNALAKDYRTKQKKTDVFIAINSLLLVLMAFLDENYYGVAFGMSYFFGYFFIGESGYFLDTEVPSVDAFQYLTCFLHYFAGKTLCY